jgi:hypothetical protein
LKSGLVLFHEAMGAFRRGGFEVTFARFERAALKGHEESLWIAKVLKGVEMEGNAVFEAFAKTNKPLGWYLAGRLTGESHFHKKSADAGCGWGQVEYARYLQNSLLEEKDENIHVRWLEKSARQKNPDGMDALRDWFRDDGNDEEKAFACYRAAAELGWKESMDSLSKMLSYNDLRQAAVWGAQGKDGGGFWIALNAARFAFEKEMTQDLDYDFDQVCYSLGWGLYWYQYGSCDSWCKENDDVKDFGDLCLDYYCSCVELQQKSIFTFLWWWNQSLGIKDVGAMIGKLAWEQREDNLVQQVNAINQGIKSLF